MRLDDVRTTWSSFYPHWHERIVKQPLWLARRSRTARCGLGQTLHEEVVELRRDGVGPLPSWPAERSSRDWWRMASGDIGR